MNRYETLNHTKWDCKYHVVWIPKYRKKALYHHIRKHLVLILRRLAGQRESRIEQGHMRLDHVHMLISIPPKYSVAQVMGYMKGKSSIHIARDLLNRGRNVRGQKFWARGYFVSTVGLDEAVVRTYIKNQEKEDRRLDQLSML